jgi:hypothetical protein
MSKLLEVFVHFSNEEWATLKKKHSEVEIKWLITKAADKAIALECERIEDSNFIITTESISEEDESA